MELLRDALCEAFDQKSFDQMLRLNLNMKREEIVKDNDFKTVTLEVIQVADRQGWVADLVRAARESNPGNPVLQKYVTDHPDALTPGKADEKKERLPGPTAVRWSLLKPGGSFFNRVGIAFTLISLAVTGFLCWISTRMTTSPTLQWYAVGSLLMGTLGGWLTTACFYYRSNSARRKTYAVVVGLLALVGLVAWVVPFVVVRVRVTGWSPLLADVRRTLLDEDSQLLNLVVVVLSVIVAWLLAWAVTLLSPRLGK
jgi:hypothetical protein